MGIALPFIRIRYSYLTGSTLRAATACYGDSFTFLYVDDVRTSQETHYWPPRLVMGILYYF
jgi:hypothetical protein